MKKRSLLIKIYQALFLISILGIFVINADFEVEALKGNKSKEYRDGVVMVGYKKSTTESQKRVMNSLLQTTEEREIDHFNVRVLRIPNGKTVEEMMDIIKTNPNIEYVEPDHLNEFHNIISPNDTIYRNFVSFRNLVRLYGDMERAWGTYTTGSTNVRIAVIDTGMHPSHQDFHWNHIVERSFPSTLNPGIHTHGVRVAGTIGAIGNNNFGSLGLMWGNVTILSLTVSEINTVPVTNTIDAINWAIDNGAHIVNMSFGGASGNTTRQNAIVRGWNQGVLFVASAGNDGIETLRWPANYPNVVGVSGTSNFGVKHTNSTWGTHVNVAAPYSYTITNWDTPTTATTVSGTSFSAPGTAAIAGLLKAYDPSLTNVQLKQYLEISARGNGVYNTLLGWGEVDGFCALNLLAFDTGRDTINMTACPQFANLNPRIMTPNLPNGAVGTAYSFAMSGALGRTPYTWSATGLPNGVSINASTGLISGTPGSSGNFNVNITLRDADNRSLTRLFPLYIGTGFEIINNELPDGLINSLYTQALELRNGTPPFTWSATGLPPGISINNMGVISGVPTNSGRFNVTITARDNLNLTAVKQLVLFIDTPPIVITTDALPKGVINEPYLFNLTAVGGKTPYTWSATNLPRGLSMNNNGRISGIPEEGGVFMITVNITDADGKVFSQVMPLTIRIGRIFCIEVILGGNG